MSNLRTNLNLETRLKELLSKIDESHSSVNVIKKYIKTVNNTTDNLSFINSMIREMRSYDWIQPISNFIDSLEESIQKFSTQLKVQNTISNLANSPGNSFAFKANYGAINILEQFVDYDGEDINEKIENALVESMWIPQCEQLVSSIKKENKVIESSTDVKVKKVFSPVDINEETGAYKIYLHGKIYELDESNNTVKESNYEVSPMFKNLVDVVENFEVFGDSFRIQNSKSIVDIKVNENIEVYLNKKLVETENIQSYLISTGAFSLNEMAMVDLIEFAASNIDKLVEMENIDSLVSTKFSGVVTNIIKLDESVYVNLINPSMFRNDLIKPTSGNDAVKIVKEFINYDITNSVTALLEGDLAKQVKLEKDRAIISERISYLNEKLDLIATTQKEIGGSTELTEAKKIIKSAIDDQKKNLGLLAEKSL